MDFLVLFFSQQNFRRFLNLWMSRPMSRPKLERKGRPWRVPWSFSMPKGQIWVLLEDEKKSTSLHLGPWRWCPAVADVLKKAEKTRHWVLGFLLYFVKTCQNCLSNYPSIYLSIYLSVSTIFASLQNAMKTLLAESVDVFLAFLTSPNVCFHGLRPDSMPSAFWRPPCMKRVACMRPLAEARARLKRRPPRIPARSRLG